MDGELLRRDYFPCEVALPDGRVIDEARVFVTSHRLLVWTIEQGQIQVAVDAQLAQADSVPGSHNTLQGSLRVDTVDGPMHINKGRGCGCHSPLKALSPAVPWRREAVAA